jgi:hypothetical protein
VAGALCPDYFKEQSQTLKAAFDLVVKNHKETPAANKTKGCILDLGVFIGGGIEGIRK